MSGRQLDLTTDENNIKLFIDSPSHLDPIDDYREVNFEFPGRGRFRVFFYLLPDKKSDDPFATKPSGEWDVPVLWDDPTMLYVPTLNDNSILAAMRYIIDNDRVDEAFENVDDI